MWASTAYGKSQLPCIFLEMIKLELYDFHAIALTELLEMIAQFLPQRGVTWICWHHCRPLRMVPGHAVKPCTCLGCLKDVQGNVLCLGPQQSLVLMYVLHKLGYNPAAVPLCLVCQTELGLRPSASARA